MGKKSNKQAIKNKHHDEYIIKQALKIFNGKIIREEVR